MGLLGDLADAAVTVVHDAAIAAGSVILEAGLNIADSLSSGSSSDDSDSDDDDD